MTERAMHRYRKTDRRQAPKPALSEPIEVSVIRAPDLHDGISKAIKIAQQLGLLKSEPGTP